MRPWSSLPGLDYFGGEHVDAIWCRADGGDFVWVSFMPASALRPFHPRLAFPWLTSRRESER